MNVQPFNDNVFIKVSKPEETTESGLLVVPTASASTNGTGEVLAVGEKVEFIKVGDIVLFDPISGKNYEDKSGTYKITSARNILGKDLEKGIKNE